MHDEPVAFHDQLMAVSHRHPNITSVIRFQLGSMKKCFHLQESRHVETLLVIEWKASIANITILDRALANNIQ